MSLPIAKTAIFVLGFTAGALGSILVLDPGDQGVVGKPAAVPKSAQSPPTAKATLKPALRAPDTTAENAKQEQLQEALEAKARELATLEQSLKEMQRTMASDEQERQQRRETMRERFTDFAQGRLESRMVSLDSVARFNDEQYNQVAAFLEERTNLQMELRSGHWSGELTEERSAEIQEQLASMKLGTYLQEILSPQQYAEYNSHRKQRNSVSQEAYAARELSRLVEAVRLTDQQLDEAYSVYYQKAESAVEEGELFDSRRMGRQQGSVEQRTELLQDILDEQQLSVYRASLERRSGFPWGR